MAKKPKTKLVQEIPEGYKPATGTTSDTTGVFCEECGAEIPTKCNHCDGKIPEKKARELHRETSH